jgi:hypothetical protein
MHYTLRVSKTIEQRAIRGRVVKFVDFKLLALHRFGFRIPTWTLDSFMREGYPSSLRNADGSTQVHVRA